MLAGYLAEARQVLAAATSTEDDTDLTPQVGVEFEQLRWFDLPSVCLT